MKQLLILSGKGGTGKTTISAAFIALSNCAAFADCDVDAPNLHLVSSLKAEPSKTDYYGLGKAHIDIDKCTSCRLCAENCRFGAIHDNMVNVYECEGCGVCAELCPTKAISMVDCVAGNLLLYNTGEQVFSTACLKMGSGTSGKLVTAVKKRLQESAPDTPLAIIDGSPGIGCPVIASISGVDMVLMVAEPTISGLHDLQRILYTVKHFGVKCAVCINKFDINKDKTKEVEDFCQKQDIRIAGKIPFDKTVIEAVNSGKSIVAYPQSPAAKAIKQMWRNIKVDYLSI